jgi:hypothetical protein
MAETPIKVAPARALFLRLRRVLRKYGFAGLVGQAFYRLRTARSRRAYLRLERSYDREHGVDTAGILRLDRLTVVGENREWATRYQSIHPEIFRDLMRALPIADPSRFTFVEFGSGKGRPLLLASEFPFKQIIGLEFCLELHEAAVANIARFHSPAQRCFRIQSICIDAAEWDPLPGPLVLFFYNPFEIHVWKRVLRKLERSLDEQPREIYVVLTGEEAVVPLVEAAGFRRLSVGSGASVRAGATARETNCILVSRAAGADG